MTTRYATEITAVGPLVSDFAAQQLLVFFADSAPTELHEFSVLHHPSVTTGGLTAGDRIELDGAVLRVLAVGALAEQNLLALGHLNIKANGATEPPLPGDVCVEVGRLPVPQPGSRLLIKG